MYNDSDDSLNFDSGDSEYDILQKSVKIITSSYNYFHENTTNYLYDYDFIFMDQWDGLTKSVRERKKKNVLTLNYLYSYCQQIIGEEVDNDPDPIVRPDSNEPGASSDHAELLEGLIRKIFIDNNMREVKLNAFKNGVFGGYGIFFVDYDYENPESFHKKITIEALSDPTIAFFDPLAKEMTKCDGDYAGYFVNMSKHEFKKTFPDAKSDLSFKGVDYLISNKDLWGGEKTVRVALLWKKERYTKTIALLSNGESMPKEDAIKLIEEQDRQIRRLNKARKEGLPIPEQMLQKITIIKERTSNDCYKIVHYKMIADEILEVNEWPSQFFPLVFVDHDSFRYRGKQYTRSFHRFAQDSQKYLNYVASQSADSLMNMHNGTWLANPEQIDDKLLADWLNPQNDKGILLANRDSAGGMPEYKPPPQISPAYDTQYMRTVRDIQNILGRFDAGRGQEDNAISGKAITSRALMGNIGSVIPFENLKNALIQVSKIVLSLIPAVYDSTRIIGIKPSHGDDKQVQINHKLPDGTIQNDMSARGFNATIEAGMSFAAQKASSIAQLNMLTQGNPELGMLLSDLIATNTDLPNSPAIVERIRKFMVGTPVPEIVSEETGTMPPPPKPNEAAEMAKAAAIQEMRLKQENMENQIAKTENEKMSNTIKTQELMNEAIDDHSKNMLSAIENRQKEMEIRMRAQAEELKALIERG